ncbi:MAG: 5'/3'-nucleotidase SurE [Clostridia bacterium]|nr:5'/3'-nucleotidase SurE [Clostridia bacterium]
MRILITNDDGIESPVLPLLVKWAAQHGEVTVVAPKHEQSGKSQTIDFQHAVEIREVPMAHAARAYAMASTPADCVRFAVSGLRTTYDLILSGINRGYNLGDDIAYSGTIGAVLEGARYGIRGIALSTDPDYLMQAPTHLDAVFAWIKEKRLLEKNALYNVNIPPHASSCRITCQGGVFYTDDFIAQGPDLYLQIGEPLKRPYDNLSLDIDATLNGYVSVTPLTASRTALDVFEELKDL